MKTISAWRRLRNGRLRCILVRSCFKSPVGMLDNSQAIYRLEPMASYDFKSRQGRLRLEAR